MSRLRNPQKSLTLSRSVASMEDFLRLMYAFPSFTHAQSCCFSPKNQAEQLSCPDSARTWAELALQDPREKRKLNANSCPPKRQCHKVSMPQMTFWLGNLHQIRMFLGAFHHQSWMPRHQSGPSHLAIVPPIAIFGVKHPVPGPGTYELSPSENAAKTLAESQGKWPENPTGWPAVDMNTSEIEKIAVKRVLYDICPDFLGDGTSFFWPSMFIFIKESNINYIPYMNIMNGYIYIYRCI